MKKAFHLLLVLTLVTGLQLQGADADEDEDDEDEEETASSGPATRPTSMEGRLKLTQANIEKLFRNRGSDAKAPDPRHNPFRSPDEYVPSPLAGIPGENDPPPPPGFADSILLREAVASLKLGRGTIQMPNAAPRISIDSMTYAEGQTIRTRVRETTVTLRITRIARDGVTFSLNGSELNVSF